jgi:hypothetical protein
VGVPAPGGIALTEAVRTVPEEFRSVAVCALATVKMSGEDPAALEPESPDHAAVMVWAPAESVEMVSAASPDVMVAEPTAVPPSENWILPDIAESSAVKVTGCP